MITHDVRTMYSEKKKNAVPCKKKCKITRRTKTEDERNRLKQK
jgi:hypothetical protein